jgi:hypothetical protein
VLSTRASFSTRDENAALALESWIESRQVLPSILAALSSPGPRHVGSVREQAREAGWARSAALGVGHLDA